MSDRESVRKPPMFVTFASSQRGDFSGSSSDIIDDRVLEPRDPTKDLKVIAKLIKISKHTHI